jgi:hypothetical protein
MALFLCMFVKPDPMKNYKVLLVFIILAVISCKKEDLKINPDNLILGTWYFNNSDSIFSVYVRSSEIPVDRTGYIFREDGTLTVRDLSGWCATPPVSYSNFEGSWKILNDTLIFVERSYWGGTLSYKLDIEAVNTKTLKLVTVY